MYDYRTPPKKRGQVQLRRSPAAGRSVTGRRSTTRSNRRPASTISKRSIPRPTRSEPLIGSLGSLITGIGLLGVAVMVMYVLLVQIILPSFFQVSRDQVLLLTSSATVEAGQPISLVRMSPVQKKLVIVHGTAPTNLADIQIPLSWQIGVPVDQMIQVEAESIETKAELVTVFRSFVTQGSQNPLTFRERMSWWLFARSVPRPQVRTYEIETTGDWATARRYLIEGRASSACPVAVLNTISKTGAASQLGSLLEQAGLIVIKVGDNQDMSEKTEIILDETASNCLQEAEWISQFVNASGDVAESQTIQQSSGIMSQYRAPIVLKIGYDLAPWLDGYSQF